MKSTKITAHVRAFFTTYVTAYIRQDVPAICGHFAETVHISTDTGDKVTVHVATSADLLQMIAQLLERYRSIGFGSAEILALATDEMSPRLVQARLRWLLLNKAGEKLYEFDAMYTLARHTEIFRITAIAHNETPQYRHYLESKAVV